MNNSIKGQRVRGVQFASLLIAFFILMSSAASYAQSSATLCGDVLKTPHAERMRDVVYVQGQTGNVWRVELAHAEFVFDAAVEGKDRAKPARKAMVPGANIRVTAIVDAATGEWTASRVEIVPHHAAKFEDDYDEDGNAINLDRPDANICTERPRTI
jgi:hypothetical protein